MKSLELLKLIQQNTKQPEQSNVNVMVGAGGCRERRGCGEEKRTGQSEREKKTRPPTLIDSQSTTETAEPVSEWAYGAIDYDAVLREGL